MKKHRIFIAVNLPREIKKQLSVYQEKWPELPVRWIKEENLHITLIFLGYLSDEEVSKVCRICKEVVLRHQPFSINLKRVCYGPPKKMPPRMVWVEGERSKVISLLKDNLEKSLASGGIRFTSENRVFSPHITLGRVRRWEWRQIEPEERPAIDQEIDLSFEVNSIEVMESVLKKGGAEYTTLESVLLGR